MSEPESAETQKDSQQSKKNKILSTFLNLIREVLAISLWGYVITKLFIFDIDNFLIERFMPGYTWLLTYKFFIIIVVISIIWLVTKHTQLILWSLFVFFYPLIIILWRIPILLFKKKSWDLVFAFIDSVIYFFKSIKKSFITTSFFLASIAVIFVSSNTVLLWFSIAVLMVILIVVYVQRVILVFKPLGIHQIYTKFFYGLGETLRTSTLIVQLDDDEASLPLESMQGKQIEILPRKWI